MDERTVSSRDLCDTILEELCEHFCRHVTEKVKQTPSSAVFDLAKLFGVIENPLFQDILTYISLLSQHASTEVITKLRNTRNKVFPDSLQYARPQTQTKGPQSRYAFFLFLIFSSFV